MKAKIGSLWVCVCLALFAAAQPPAVFSDAVGVALGRAAAASATEGWWMGNPAAGMERQQTVLALQTAMPYGLPELTVSGLAAAGTLGSGRWSLALQSYGLDAEQHYLGLMMGYGRRLHEHWTVGVQFASLQERVTAYGSRMGLALRLGLQWQLDENWRFGCIWQPYTGGDFGPARLSLGLQRRFGENLRLLLDLNQTDEVALPSWNLGLEYAPARALMLRLGLNLLRFPSGAGSLLRVQGGVGYAFGSWQLDVAAEYHPYLGFTPFLNLQRKILKL